MCLLLAAVVFAAVPPPDSRRAGLAQSVLIGSPWTTQASHLSVAALPAPLPAVPGGSLSVPAARAPFAHPVVFRVLGGFALAAALQHQGLDRALARHVLRRSGLTVLLSPSTMGALYLVLRPGLDGRGPRRSSRVCPASPPNAIVHGTGQVPQATMVRCGLVLDPVFVGAVAAAAFLAFG